MDGASDPSSVQGGGATSSFGDGGSGSSNLSYLVPTYDPGKDDLLVYSQKVEVELLCTAWPESKGAELVARLILGRTGSAFQKLQQHQAEKLAAGKMGVKKLVELLGGYWGRIPWEQDETNDSYLARADIVWSDLLSKNTTLEEIQAYVVLRVSALSAEDKKRVVIEADAQEHGSLNMKKVSASVRVLGAGFFHEMTSGKRVAKHKTYDNTAFVLTKDAEEEGETHQVHRMISEEYEDELQELPRHIVPTRTLAEDWQRRAASEASGQSAKAPRGRPKANP